MTDKKGTNLKSLFFSFAVVSLAVAVLLLSGCAGPNDVNEEDESDAPVNQTANANALGCNHGGFYQAHCLAEKALAANDLTICDVIDAESLLQTEKVPENRAQIPAVKMKCYYDIAIKTNNPEGCYKTVNSKYIYNQDICLFKLAQSTHDVSLCVFGVTQAGRVNPDGGAVYNQLNCIDQLKATLTKTGCGKDERRDMSCVVSLGFIKADPKVCDEFFTVAGNGNKQCTFRVESLMEHREQEFFERHP